MLEKGDSYGQRGCWKIEGKFRILWLRGYLILSLIFFVFFLYTEKLSNKKSETLWRCVRRGMPNEALWFRIWWIAPTSVCGLRHYWNCSVWCSICVKWYISTLFKNDARFRNKEAWSVLCWVGEPWKWQKTERDCDCHLTVSCLKRS